MKRAAPVRDLPVLKDKIPLSAFELTVLLDNIYRGAALPSIGFEHTYETLDTFCSDKNQKMLKVDLEWVQDALWSCTQMEENGKFWHPKNTSYDGFLARILPPEYQLNKFTGCLEKVNDKKPKTRRDS